MDILANSWDDLPLTDWGIKIPIEWENTLMWEVEADEIEDEDYEGTEEPYFGDEQTKHEIKLPQKELDTPFWEWMNSMSEIYIMFSGGKDSMAAIRLYT